MRGKMYTQIGTEDEMSVYNDGKKKKKLNVSEYYYHEDVFKYVPNQGHQNRKVSSQYYYNTI